MFRDKIKYRKLYYRNITFERKLFSDLSDDEYSKVAEYNLISMHK